MLTSEKRERTKLNERSPNITMDTEESTSPQTKSTSAENSYRKCNICFQVCKDLAALRSHVKCHCIHAPFMCTTCCHVFAEEHDLEMHSKSVTHPVVKAYFCTKCRKLYKGGLGKHKCKPARFDFLGGHRCHYVLVSAKELEGINASMFSRYHIYVKCSDKNESMDRGSSADDGVICNDEYQTMLVPCIADIVFPETNKKHKCTMCGKSVVTVKELSTFVAYLETQMKEHSYVCEKCGKTFFALWNLEQHFRTMHSENTFPCDKCEFSFPTAKRLQTHQLFHTGERPFCCNQCGLTFMTQDKLNGHILGSHRMDEKYRYKCKECHKSYVNSTDLKVHMRKHTGEKPYVCTYCGKSFAAEKHLRRHVKVLHPVDKPYKCSMCKLRFTNKETRTIHERKHDKEVRFYCNVCNKSFRFKGTLTDHMRIHSEEFPFECDICFRSFRRANGLTSHYRSHTGEKPYKCIDCKKAYSQINSLHIHNENYHKNDLQHVRQVLSIKESQSANVQSVQKKTELKVKQTDENVGKLRNENVEKIVEYKNPEKSVASSSEEILTAINSIQVENMEYVFELENFDQSDFIELEMDETYNVLNTMIYSDHNHFKMTSDSIVPGDVNIPMIEVKGDFIIETESPYECDVSTKVIYLNELPLNDNQQIMKDPVSAISHEVEEFSKPKTNSSDSVASTSSETKSNIILISEREYTNNNPEHDLKVSKSDIRSAPSKDLHVDCEKCGGEFRDLKHYELHISKCAEIDRPYKCDECSKRFAYKRSVNAHKHWIHSGKVRYNCDKCDLGFRSDVLFDRHNLFHSGKKAFMCHICGAPYDSDYEKQMCSFRHNRKFDPKAFKCSVCHKGLNSRNALEQHLRTQHVGHVEPKFECHICHGKFKWEHTLKIHILNVHTKGRCYQCDKCGKAFKTRPHLQAHLTFVHADNRTYQCYQCLRTFSSVIKYNAHLREHEGKVPYECNICKYTCKHSSTMKSHSRQHTGEKPFGCDFCGKTFAHRNAQVAHIRTHTDERPYHCGMCGKCFRQLSHLRSHEKSHGK